MAEGGDFVSVPSPGFFHADDSADFLDPNGLHRKILIIGDGWWHNAGVVKSFAVGFTGEFVFFPGPFAAKILHRIKQGDQCDQAGQAKEDLLEIPPTAEPADKPNGDHDQEGNTQRQAERW